MIDLVWTHIMLVLFMSCFTPWQRNFLRFRLIYTRRKNSQCLDHMAMETCQAGLLAMNSSRSGVSCNYTRQTLSWLLGLLPVMKMAIGFPLSHKFETTLGCRVSTDIVRKIKHLQISANRNKFCMQIQHIREWRKVIYLTPHFLFGGCFQWGFKMC